MVGLKADFPIIISNIVAASQRPLTFELIIKMAFRFVWISEKQYHDHIFSRLYILELYFYQIIFTALKTAKAELV